MSDSRYSANSRVTALIDLLRDRCSGVEKSADVAQRKLMQTVEIAQLQDEANQVCRVGINGGQCCLGAVFSWFVGFMWVLGILVGSYGCSGLLKDL